MDFDFNPMVNKFVEREVKPKQIGRYYPSEVGNCLRKVWYSYKYPQKIDNDLLKIFEVGDMLHGFVVEVLKSEKNKEVELLKTELPFEIELKDFIISGRVDDLIVIKESGKEVLIEVKSTKSIESIREVQEHHRMQLMFYMVGTGIHNGIVLYVDKNNLKSKVFEVPFDEIEAAEIIKRFEHLHKCLIANQLPEPEAKEVQSMKWMCNLCEYAKKCGGEEK